MKKKTIIILFSLILNLGLFTGCGESTPLLSADDFELDALTNKTSLGVGVGDTTETFFNAYGEYRFFTSIDNGDYQVLVPEEISFDSPVTILLPTFFIDGLPMEPDAFCEENNIEKAELISYLSSADYLNLHTVEYRYLAFTWENGTITDIRPMYMNYNEDGAN
ncbi:MAG: hypothetical protein J1F42_02300 [Lachnospiraceae bacterium]|nr:hypothetical protein [Lachnospiraceae bacterium]